MVWHHTVWAEAELVYTSVAKVANTSIKTALLASFHPDVPRQGPHAPDLPYVSVRPSRIATKYPSFCHFAVVRNPFDRVVSFWADKIAGPTRLMPSLERLGMAKGMSFADTLRIVVDTDDSRADGHFRSQSFLLTDSVGRLHPHLLLRFERLEDDWDLLRWMVAERNGARIEPLPRRRVSDHRDFRDYYDEQTWALTAERYATDLKLLNYPAEPEAVAAGDGVTDRRLAESLAGRPAAVLDLTAPSAQRIAVVNTAGGRYLGLARESAFGELVATAPLDDGRIDHRLFDVLVLRRFDRGLLSPHRRLHDQFTASGRTVVVAPDSLGSVVGRRARQLGADLAVVRRRGVRKARSVRRRMSRRFRAT